MAEDNPISFRFLPAHRIDPKDDTFHGSKYLLDIEWWYFDAIFENGMSAHIGFRIYHIRDIGMLQTRINLYKNGELIKEKIKIYPLSNTTIDTKKPSIIINDKKVVSFQIDTTKKEKPWTYNIDVSVDDISLSLNFTGQTEGWKIETESTCWAVPLPHATVTGSISINEKTKTVKGTGYHDHNWGYSPTTVLRNIGWYWGRISANNLHTTWANTIITKTKQDLLTIVNKPYNHNNQKPFFTSIHPDNITFKTMNYKKQNSHSIPTSFELSFAQHVKKTDEIVKGTIKMDTIDIHYDRIFIIDYWRYHVNVSGTIQYGENIEKINEKPQIIEYLHF